MEWIEDVAKEIRLRGRFRGEGIRVGLWRLTVTQIDDLQLRHFGRRGSVFTSKSRKLIRGVIGT